MPILILFIFSILLLGSYHIGGLSARVIATIVIIAYLILNKNNCKLTFNNTPIYIYVLYIIVCVICMILSSGFSGVNELEPLIKRIFANYLVCIICYYSIDYIVKSYNNLNKIILLLVFIGLLNDIATLLQYLGNPMGIAIGALFSTNSSEYLTNIADNLNRVSEMGTAMPGIFGHGAINGYMTASLGMITLYYVFCNSFTKKLLGLLLYIFAAVGTFCCQERSGFGLFLLFSLLSLWRFNAKAIKYCLPFFIIIVFIILTNYLTTSGHIESIGRYANLMEVDNDRKVLINNALNFIETHFILGGEVEYSKVYGLTPHNMLLHSFIYSGLLGAIVIIYLTFYIIIQGCKTILKTKQANPSFFFACGLLIYLINGFFHSTSLITGEVAIWILYACMLKSNNLNNLQTFYNKNHENIILLEKL